MKMKCWDCKREFEVKELNWDALNSEGFYVHCPHHNGTIDIDFDTSKTFIGDIPKMADFTELSKEEFLQSYSYLTEEEYDMTKLYYDWLMR